MYIIGYLNRYLEMIGWNFALSSLPYLKEDSLDSETVVFLNQRWFGVVTFKPIY
jgi:hypothetical protein